jgi:hypothetical protein
MATVIFDGQPDFGDQPAEPPEQGGNTAVFEGEPEFASGVQQQDYPKGLSGSVKAQVQGQLHGLTGVLGMPGDFASWAARGSLARAPKVNEVVQKFLPTSTWMRKLLDLPVAAQNQMVREWPEHIEGKPAMLKGRATYDDINEVPEEYRPMARSGEVVGSTYPIVGGLSRAARNVPAALSAAREVTPSVGRNIVRSQVGAAAEPGFMAAQAPATLGAGAGAYGAEFFFPGSNLAQVIAQLGGGIAGAGTGIAGKNAVTAATNRLTDPLATMTPEGAERAIARAIAKELEKYGEDPAALIRRLSEPDAVPGALPAERSGSRVLMGVQETLAKHDPDLANSIAKSNEQFRARLAQSLQDEFSPAPQANLTGAAKDYDDYLQGLVSNARQEARATAEHVQPLAPAEREAANRQARDALERALRVARTRENQLWGAVDRDGYLPILDTNAAHEVARRDMLPEEKFPSVIEAVLKRFGDEPVQQFGELQRFRSLLLSEARKARSQDDWELNRRLNMLADGALEDMSRMGGQEVERARDFSRILNDRFSRSFAGDVLGLKDTGAPAVRPELTLERAGAGTGARPASQMRELRTAVEPIGGGPPRPEMQQAQEQFVRTLSQNVIDPSTGAVKPDAAMKFMRDNGPLLEQFPQYREALDTAVTAQIAADYMAVHTADNTRKQVFAKILGSGEKPAVAVGKIIMGENPHRDLAELVRIAQRGGPEAVGGLRGAIMEFVTKQAATKDGVSYETVREILTQPMTPGGRSLLDAMRVHNVVTPDQRRAILDRIALGTRHQNASKTAARIDDVGDEASKELREGTRILGAKLASWLGVTGGGAGPSLQVAQIAANVSERALAKYPIERARKIIQDAMKAEDPQQLISILERITGPSDIRAGRGLKQPHLISILRPLFPRTETAYEGVTAEELARRLSP